MRQLVHSDIVLEVAEDSSLCSRPWWAFASRACELVGQSMLVLAGNVHCSPWLCNYVEIDEVYSGSMLHQDPCLKVSDTMSDILAASMAVLSFGHEGPSGYRQTYFEEKDTVQTRCPEEKSAQGYRRRRDETHTVRD